MDDLTPEDRAWLRQFDEALSEVRKTDLGEDPRRLGKIKERFAMDPRYPTLAMACLDIERHHRDRLIGRPVYGTPGMDAVYEAPVAERTARIEGYFREPEPAPELSAPPVT